MISSAYNIQKDQPVAKNPPPQVPMPPPPAQYPNPSGPPDRSGIVSVQVGHPPGARFAQWTQGTYLEFQAGHEAEVVTYMKNWVDNYLAPQCKFAIELREKQKAQLATIIADKARAVEESQAKIRSDALQAAADAAPKTTPAPSMSAQELIDEAENA